MLDHVTSFRWPSAANHGRKFQTTLAMLSFAGVLGGTTPARAGEIPTVNLTDAGPDRDVPLGSFYLAGTASAQTTKVQAVIIRTTDPWLLGGTDAPSCTSVLQSFGTTDKLDTGSVQKNWARFVPDPWVRPSSKDKEPKEAPFKIFVNTQDFFKRGSSYCTFVLKTTEEKKNEDVSAEQFVNKFAVALQECDKHQTDALFAANDVPTYDKCIKAASTRFDLDIASLKLDPEPTKKLTQSAQTLTLELKSMQGSRSRIYNLLTSWATSLETNTPTVIKTYVVPPLGYIDVNWPPNGAPTLGTAIALLLAERHQLRMEKRGFSTWSSGTPVTRLRLAADFENILVGNERTLVSVEIGAKDLKLPESELTLLDLLELSRSRLRYGDAYLSVADLQKKLLDLLSAKDINNTDREKLVAAQRHWKALSRYVRRALLAKTPAAEIAPKTAVPERAGRPPTEPKLQSAEKPPTEGLRLEQLLGDWLATITVQCNKHTYDTWVEFAPLSAKFCNDQGLLPAEFGSAWPGYAKSVDHGPIGRLADDLEDFLSKEKKYADGRASLKTQKENIKTTIKVEHFSKKFSFTQENWVFTYLTPVVGYGIVPLGTDTFNLGYTAVQLHFVPNRTDEPLWIHGRKDIRRFAALELGLGLPATTYGPGNRYRGWKGLPPLFLGATLHILPYTGLSGGLLVLERRTSALSDEAATIFASPYIGLNVNVNIPDLVRELTSPTTTKTQ